MIGLSPGRVRSVAVVGAHPDDIAIGAGGTLLDLTRAGDVQVHALVLTGGGTDREAEERKALSDFCSDGPLSLTVLDIPDGRTPDHWSAVKEGLETFRRTCEPDIVLAPQRRDAHQDHRLLAESVPTVFRDHLILGYEIVKWESDLPTPGLYHPLDDAVAERKAELLSLHYPSQHHHDWYDAETFLGLARVRGVQCRSRYAEAFVVEKMILHTGHRPSDRPTPQTKGS
ncbi:MULTISPECIES: PIG-L deacetylase family protein [Nocardiaceae]|uniref:LmbE family N-acetylglucosaminyl deacetylase n=1 Tax=Rhodococcoides corynebacterioides TaxID=53972 RepID=A0ABS2KWN2_9NOCA|nr:MULTISPECIES: PIG-L deacetylase family protein [Rhodococcus]MBM7416317.1 LmbE family N-acetylglucosaminyl deacetylase [Rhodococcus corynebacterioides]MBP1114570.1 LmbE family N-acetylglucosaminyl deacetylase [Rhodococcus sp. PvP016]